MTSPTGSVEDQLDEVLTKAFNDFYDYITEKDVIKAAHEYSEKSIYVNAREALLKLQSLARLEELENLERQRKTKMVGSELFPSSPKMEVYEVPIYLIWNRIAELKRINKSKERIAELEREEQ